MLSRIVSGIAGAAIIGAVVHYSINANGGYNLATSPLFVALAVGLIAGAIACGRSTSRTLGLGIVLAMLAGEGFQLIQTAERTTGLADARQAPLREAAMARTKAADAIADAERALSRLGDTPRLLAAIDAKKAADEAVRNDAAKPGCKTHCRALLEQQVQDAQKEANDARAELDRSRAAAQERVSRARQALDALPAAPSATPLADRLGVEQWQIDLTSAVLLSVGANGLGAFLLAFAFHARRRDAVAAVPVETPTVELVPVSEPITKREPMKEANRFAGETFRPCDSGRVPLVDVRHAYHDWCRRNALPPLPDDEIGAALSKLFAKVGLVAEGTGRESAIVGIDWTVRAITKAA